LTGLAIGFVIVTVINVLFGSKVLAIPTFGSGRPVGMPMRRELPIAYAAMAAGSLHSAMRDAELTACRKFVVWERIHTAVVCISSVLAVGAVEFVVSGTESSVVMTRATLVWLGLSLLSGRAFGRQLSWVLPVMSIFPLTYLQQDSQGHDRWWDWTGQPAGSFACVVISVGALWLGLMAIAATPWRIASLRRYGSR